MGEQTRFLILEDSKDDAFLLIRELKKAGFDLIYERVETKEGMLTALEKSWDLILADFTMPRFNALSALSILKEMSIDIPFIIVSGTIGEERAIAAMKAGANDYINKSDLFRLKPIIERELREAQNRKALAEQERYFQALIENISDIVVAFDSMGKISYANSTFTRVLGYPLAELDNLDFFALIYIDDIVKQGIALNRLLADPRSQRDRQFRIQHRDGSWRWMEATFSNFLDEPGIQALVANLHDVTERNELQAQLLQAQKMEAVGQLTAGIAHDFNNMLTVTNSYAELLALRFPNDQAIRYMAERILDGGERAANLVRQLLTFSQKQITYPEILDLNEKVTQMEKLLVKIIGEHISISTEQSDNLWTIKADPTHIEQIVMNLVVNARDAMPEGGQLFIETGNEYLDEEFTAPFIDIDPGPFVRLTIQDTGIGMDEAVKARIFEPFFTTKEEGKGTGLGLATVYGIVKQSEACITIDSEIGVGTAFHIYFPSAEVVVLPDAPITNGFNQNSHGGTILLVEDNEFVREVIEEVLEDLGYSVLNARSGPSGLEKANSYEGVIDLLLTDIVMPGFSGRVLAEEILKTRPDLKVLFMTGYSEETISDFGLEMPNISLIQKPYTHQKFAEKIWEIFNLG